MAKKEYTRGDVVNIFGRVIGRGIELSGGALLLLSKGLARFARGVFWISGKHVDMVETLKELKQKKVVDAEEIPLLSEGENSMHMIVEKLSSVERALSYSQSVYENDILPKDEILKIDTQALIMAKAIRNIMDRTKDLQLKNEGIKVAEAFIKASKHFIKYHSVTDKHKDNNKYDLMAEAGEVKKGLLRLQASVTKWSEEENK